jgi:hypothetical protein
MTPALFGSPTPPWWSPIAQGCAVGLLAGVVGYTVGGQDASAGALWGSSWGAFGVFAFSLVYNDRNGAGDGRGQVEPVEYPDMPQTALPTGERWIKRSYAAEVNGMLRDLVDPAIPVWQGREGRQYPTIEQVRRLAQHAVRGKLTHREVTPVILARGEWDKLRPWLIAAELVCRLGNSDEIVLTEAGRAWMREVLGTYPNPMVRVQGQKHR